MLHGERDGARLQHLGPLRGQFQHFLVGNPVDLPGRRYDPRIGSIDAIDVRVDIAAIRVERRCEGDGRCVGAAAAERCDPVVRANALEAREDGNLTLLEAVDDLIGLDVLDPGLAMHAIGPERQLPGEPGAGVDPDILQGHGQQAARHLLACRDDGVVFAGVMQHAHLARIADQLIGDPGHGRDDDGHFIAGIDFFLDPLSHILDAFNIGDGRAAELLHDTRHFVPLFRSVSPMPKSGTRAFLMAPGGAIHSDTSLSRQDRARC